MIKWAVWVDYYSDGRYGGFIVHKETGHGSTFRTTDLKNAMTFENPVAAARELKAAKDDVWMLQYPSAKLEVVQVKSE